MPSRFDHLHDRLVPVDGNDMFPIHRGARTTVETVTHVLQYAEQGSRQQYVDVLRELIEADPHAYSVCSKLTAEIGGVDCEWMPAKFEEGTADHANAKTVCEFVAETVDAIPEWATHKRSMLWGAIFGNASRELVWTNDDGWRIGSLEFIHSRRVAYDSKFRATFVDAFGNSTGIRPRDPAHAFKFWFFQPQLSDEYPTREGLGRVLIYWLAFKRFDVRELLSYIESRGKPLMDVSYEVGERTANEKEVQDAIALAKAWSAGSTGGGAHPSTIKANLVGPGSGSGNATETPHMAFLKLCDEQISKCVLGGTLPTQEGDRGARSLGETQRKGEQSLEAMLARSIDDSIRGDIARAIVILNFGPKALKYVPRHHTKIEPPEDDEAAMRTVGGLADRGQPIPTQWVSTRFGIPHAQPGESVLSKDGVAKAMETPTVEDEPPDPKDGQDGEDNDSTPPKDGTAKDEES